MLRIIRRTAVGTAMLLGVSLLGAVPTAATPDRPGDVAEEGQRTQGRHGVTWRPCFQEEGPDFECATVKVPLDYDHPRGRRIGLALVRLPAADPDNRIGSLFINPGGPGGSGVDVTVGLGPFVGLVYGPEVRERYDLVGMDPRGIARSTPLICFDDLDEAFSSLASVAFPLTLADFVEIARSNRTLIKACGYQGGKIISHMSTANVARDLDLLRRRLGDDKLNYLGFSYGSFLGVTYANLFPERVGSLVVDAVLDPVRWVNRRGKVPFSTRLRSDQGAQKTLDELFRLCDAAGPPGCALAPGSSERFDRVAKRVRSAPLPVTDPETGESFVLDYQTFIEVTLDALYDPFIYPQLAAALVELEEAASAERTGRALRRLVSASPLVSLGRATGEFPEYPDYVNFVEGPVAVLCSDTDNPRSYRSWLRAGERAEKRFGYFGRIWTWRPSVCAKWPFRDRDRYTGPFTADTANPVLVVGNTFDPATRYEGAQVVRALLPNSALVTVEATGHTSLGLSRCAEGAIGAYLLDPSVANGIDGLTCPAEFNPFDLVAPQSPRARGDADARRDVRSALLSEVAVRPTR